MKGVLGCSNLQAWLACWLGLSLLAVVQQSKAQRNHLDIAETIVFMLCCAMSCLTVVWCRCGLPSMVAVVKALGA